MSDRPLIVLAGPSALEIGALAAADVIIITDPAGYGGRLVSLRPALIVVDGREPGWKPWAVIPRANAATRRIPVIVLCDSQAVRGAAMQAGASAALSPEDFAAEFPRLLHELAQSASQAVRAALSDACAEPLPPQAVEAISLFNAGDYYRQHDLLEALWMSEDRPIRNLYQAILQVGIAYYHIERGNPRGALKTLLKAQQWLAALPDICQGVDVARLRADAAAVRAEIERLGEARFSRFNRSLLQPVRRADSPPDHNSSTA